MVAELTYSSDDGTIALPKNLRDALSITPGTRLLLMDDGDGILIKPVREKSPSEINRMLDECNAWGRESGLTEQDIVDSIKEVRRRKHER